jgi:hypothetical protein
MVCVKWLDAHEEDGWIDLLTFENGPDAVIYSVGWLMEESHGGKDGHVTLALCWSDDDMVHSVFHIPELMVQSVTVLEVSREFEDVTSLLAASSTKRARRNGRTAKIGGAGKKPDSPTRKKK